jgi:glycerol-3-phosphate dehydrogenase
VVTITGGKLTTYREMAADTVDEVLHQLGGRLDQVAHRTKTKRMKLRGADGYQDALAVDAHLADRHGGETRTLLAMIEKDPALGEPLVDGLPYLRAEAVYAARYEMARDVEDVLTRRTRARLLAREASAAAAADVADLIGPELGWTEDQKVADVAAYRAAVEHERETSCLPPTITELVGGG